jgi:hypothetical protein
MQFFDPNIAGYYKPIRLKTESFICGHCNNPINSDSGYKIGEHQDGSGNQFGGVYICPSCLGATFIAPSREQFPKPTFGKDVDNLSEDLDRLYIEARQSTSVGAYTASILTCRKILMHVAVDLLADENQSFVKYVEWLYDNNHIPRRAKTWVDYIRTKGNEANHEIVIMNEEEAKKLINFIEILLKSNYEFPSIIEEDS